MDRKRKIGLFFGTFNPVHNGHLIMANYVLEHCGLDEIRLVVSPDSPFKEHRTLLPFEKRVLIAKTALVNHPLMAVSEVEGKLAKPTYTINTLNYYKEKYGERCEFVLIVGADNFENLLSFHKASEIIANFRILVCGRNGIDCREILEHILDEFKHTGVKGIEIVEGVPNVQLSSTFIRNEVESGRSINFYVPSEIERLVTKGILAEGDYLL